LFGAGEADPGPEVSGKTACSPAVLPAWQQAGVNGRAEDRRTRGQAFRAVQANRNLHLRGKGHICKPERGLDFRDYLDMRIRCPSCSATYEVPDTMLDPPRTVRCAKCAHDWTAVAILEPEVPEAPEEAAEPEVAEMADAVAPYAAAEDELPLRRQGAQAARERLLEPEPVIGDTPLSAIERLALGADMSPQIRRRDRLLTAAWAASFAALTALGVAGYTERNVLMHQWPASKRVYATLGLTPVQGKAMPAQIGGAKDGPAPVVPAKPAQ
jgi:predicted Zn finger-like uncharacterized protein